MDADDAKPCTVRTRSGENSSRSEPRINQMMLTEQSNPSTMPRTADHELAVDALMDEYDAHVEDRRRNIAINRQRSQRKTMLRVAQRRRLKESKRMRSVQVFKQLNEKSLSAIVDAMTPCTFAPGEIIVQQGDPAESFFIIVKGSCVVRKKTIVFFCKRSDHRRAVDVRSFKRERTHHRDAAAISSDEWNDGRGQGSN